MQAWIETETQGADFGDERLNRRYEFAGSLERKIVAEHSGGLQRTGRNYGSVSVLRQ
jgi:hypothetical protein